MVENEKTVRGGMSEGEISEFISKSIEQIKSGLPKGCVLNGNFDFDISVITTKETGGKIGIQLANIGHSRNTQQVHRIRFPIVDEKSRQKNIQQCMNVLKDFMSELSEFEHLEKLKE